LVIRLDSLTGRARVKCGAHNAGQVRKSKVRGNSVQRKSAG